MGASRALNAINSRVPFSIDEFCIVGADQTPQHIKEKIWRYHISPVINVRHKIDLPLTASEKSCYRPFKWEIERGRSGLSQHTFGEGQDDEENHLGACDWTFHNQKDITLDNINSLFRLLMKETKYTRLCVYPTFIHCDYKMRNGTRQVFECPDNKWVFRYSRSLYDS